MSFSRVSKAGGKNVLSRAVRAALAGVVVLFLAGHLPLLVTAPSDIDEMNFVLGVRRFDVAAHQPHPPGYPVFIALGKLARPVSTLWSAVPFASGGAAAVESRALAFWAALLGAFALVPLFVFFRNLEDRVDLALAAAAVTAAAPLYWFTAARPLSDVPGFAAVVLVDALLLAVWRRRQPVTPDPSGAPGMGPAPDRLMVGAAFVAGLAAGLRAQTFWLVAPLFVFVMVGCRDGRARLTLRCAVVWAIGVAIWLIPMLVSTGGPRAYLGALQWQASDDLAGVQMLMTQPSARQAALALINTFVTPWAAPIVAQAALVLAAIGAVALVFRGRRALLLLSVAFVPYAVFHLLFQETATARYALPLLPAVAYLAVRGLETVARRWWRWAAGVVVSGSLVIGAVALVDHTHDQAPVFQALTDMRARQASRATAAPVCAVHQPYRPMLRGEPSSARVLPLTPMYEWLDLTHYWLNGERAAIWFLADPRRAGLAQIDPRSRRLVQDYTFAHWWPFTGVLLGGSRPGPVQWWELESPGWMLGEGWAVTPEAGGVARPGHRGPHEAPVVGYVRRRPDAVVLMIGGRHLAPEDPRPVTLTASLDGRPIASWVVRADPGWFLQWIDAAPGVLTGADGFATLTVAAASDSPPVPRVGLEQFDLQSQGTVVFGFGEGWHELEYDNKKGRLWRWTSDRATTVVRHAGQDLTLRLAGESPLKYFDEAPQVTVRAGDSVLAHFTPSADFTEDVALPAAALDRAGGLVVLETTRTFVPAEAGASPDRRRLGLRIFELTIR